MRSPALQYLYLQKPITTVIIICMISVLPWLGMGDFSTSEEAREASVAAAMLETGNWTLPEVYAGQFSHNPPLQHWLIALFSLPKGEVTPFTSRLPSALAFMTLIGLTLSFLGQRIRFQNAFITVLILISCIGLHFTAMIAGVYMLFTTFVLAAIYEMYKWEEKQDLKGIPPAIPLLISGAILTKGLIGLLLPILIFSIYLILLKRYDFLRIFKSLLYILITALFIPAIWYFAAWKQGGDAFTQIIIAENYGLVFNYSQARQFIESANPKGVGYMLTSLLGGFMPWTVLAVLSLFTLSFKRKKSSKHQRISDSRMSGYFREEEKIRLLAIITIIVSLILFSIPVSKSASLLLITYPFIALFLAQYFIYLSANKAFITRLFAGLLFLFTTTGIVIIIATMTGFLDPALLVSQYTESQAIIELVENIKNISIIHKGFTIVLLVFLTIASATVCYQLFKKINIKIIYAAVFLAFVVNVFTDSVFIRGIRKGSTSKLFARMIKKDYPIQSNNIYVVADNNQYTPLYGMNFYLDGALQNFHEQLEKGYLLVSSKDYNKVKTTYGDTYTFSVVSTSSYFVRDSKSEIILTEFIHKKQ